MDKYRDISYCIDKIRSDNQSGAAELTRKAARIFFQLSDLKTSRKQELLSDIITVSHLLMKSQPSMAPILNLVNTVLLDVENTLDVKSIRRALRTSATNCVERMEDSERKTVTHTVETIRELGAGARILTHSYSSTVLNSIFEANAEGLRPHITCTESRPANEGRKVLKKLSSNGVKTTFIVDMLAFSLIEQGDIDLVLIGADSVLTSGLVNKIGTAGLASICNRAGVPIVSLLSSAKILTPELEQFHSIERKPHTEVLRSIPKCAEVLNIYFDTTPLSLISGFITERGRQNADEFLNSITKVKVSRLLAQK